LPILKSELQRNLTGLKKEPVAPYFMSYTVHEVRSAALSASFGALERSDDSRQRFASVEVRVGDYALDNTHPMRGDVNGGSRVGLSQVPLTDEEGPVRLALWRATDRSFKQATESLTRVKANVASKIQDDHPPPDFSRQPAESYTGQAVSFELD